MAKKYYAVRKGHSTGVFETWVECQNATDGYSSAVFKAFTTREQAVAYLNGENFQPDNIYDAKETNTVIAYVDGSYDDKIKRYSYGLVLILPTGEIIEEGAYAEDEEALSARNVAGELLGVMIAIKKTIDLNFESLHIFHDYEGISKWINKEWNAKSIVANKYVKFVESKTGNLDIKFTKVKSHSGDFYNEKADRLAKEALAHGEKYRSGKHWLVIEKLHINDLVVILDLIKEDFPESKIFKTDVLDKTTWIISSDNEKVTIIYYKSKEKLTVQGKPQAIFTVLSTYVTELIDGDQISDVFNPYYQVNVDKTIIEAEYDGYLLNKNIPFTEKLDNSIKQAIYNLNLNGEMYDYTFLAFPIIRALEGFLKLILNKHAIELKDNFDMFELKDNGTYKLAEKYHSKVGSPGIISYIGKLYRYYNKHRHSLFHWDNPSSGTDTTRILDSKHWQIFITDSLQLINEYFIIK